MNEILVVEDDDSIRDFVSTLLMDEGYTVLTATNGAEALQVVENSAPTLILVDMLMPVMDGRKFLEAYRKLPIAHAPVVGMSANTQQGELSESFNGFLAKPFNLDDLLSCVHQFMVNG